MTNLTQKKLTIIGFGNQAKAWAHNLRDSNFNITIGLREKSSNFQLVIDSNFKTLALTDIQLYENPVALLIPDHEQELFFAKYANIIPPQTTFVYAHGYSLHFDRVHEKYNKFNHVLFAPKAIATELRSRFQQKEKLGAVYSLENISSHDNTDWAKWIKELAFSLGINVGPFETTFEKETLADLFSEQSLLCSAIPYTALNTFNILVKNGISPELAYLEVWMELEFIVKAMVQVGPSAFFDLISPNALVGAEKGKNHLINEDFKQKLEHLFLDIKSGAFTQEIKNTDIENLRQQVKNRWRNEPFNHTIEKYQGQK